MTRIILVGAGSGERTLVELFHTYPNVEIVGLADKTKSTVTGARARIWFARNTNYQELLAGKRSLPYCVVDVTRDPAVARLIHKLKADGTEVIGGGGLSHTLLGG